MDIKALSRLAASIWDKRQPVEAALEELAKFIYPDAGGFQTKLSESAEGRDEIWDSTPEEAANALAAALSSLLTNPATDWFGLDMGGSLEPDGDEARWLTASARTILDALAAPESQFYSAADSFYLNLVIFAWGVLLSEYRDGKGLFFRSVPLSECALAEGPDGMADTLVRRFSLSAAQMAAEYRQENMSDAARKALEKDPMRLFEITHIVLPRERLPKVLEARAADEQSGVKRPGFASDSREAVPEEAEGKTRPKPVHPWVSVVFEPKGERPLHLGGYFEFPYAVPRWAKRSGEIYGRGCGHAALPDIRVLNRVSASQLDAAEKASDPPLLVPDDSVLDRRINTHAGGITYWRPAGGEITPLPVSSSLDTMQLIREERKDSIRRMFLNDRIQLAGGPQMSATEVMARERKQNLILGPVKGRLESEYLGTLISRVFNLLYRAGKLPQAPESLRGKDLVIRYISPLARTQKLGEAESFGYALNFSAPLIQGNPALLDNFDQDAIVRDTQEVFGYPAKYLRDEDAVAKIREERAKAAQAQAQAQAGAAGQAMPEQGGM